MDIGEQEVQYDVPEPAQVPDFVPEEVPAAPVPEPVPA
jgi:hypothetical protein